MRNGNGDPRDIGLLDLTLAPEALDDSEGHDAYVEAARRAGRAAGRDARPAGRKRRRAPRRYRATILGPGGFSRREWFDESDEMLARAFAILRAGTIEIASVRLRVAGVLLSGPGDGRAIFFHRPEAVVCAAFPQGG